MILGAVLLVAGGLQTYAQAQYTSTPQSLEGTLELAALVTSWGAVLAPLLVALYIWQQRAHLVRRLVGTYAPSALGLVLSPLAGLLVVLLVRYVTG